MSAGAKRKRKRQSMGQSIGGVLFGFEQQVWRNVPPPEELVHHARPGGPVAAADGSTIEIRMPDDVPGGGPGAPVSTGADDDEAHDRDANDGDPHDDDGEADDGDDAASGDPA